MMLMVLTLMPMLFRGRRGNGGGVNLSTFGGLRVVWISCEIRRSSHKPNLG